MSQNNILGRQKDICRARTSAQHLNMEALEGGQSENPGGDVRPQPDGANVRLLLALHLGRDVHTRNLMLHYRCADKHNTPYSLNFIIFFFFCIQILKQVCPCKCILVNFWFITAHGNLMR